MQVGLSDLVNIGVFTHTVLPTYNAVPVRAAHLLKFGDVTVLGPGRDVIDLSGHWPILREISETGCLLVRPDMSTGYRADAIGNVTQQVRDALLDNQGRARISDQTAAERAL